MLLPLARCLNVMRMHIDPKLCYFSLSPKFRVVSAKEKQTLKRKGKYNAFINVNPNSDGLSDSVAPVGEILWLQPAKYQGRSPFRHHDNDATDKLLSCTFRAYMQTFGRKFPIVLSEISEY